MLDSAACTPDFDESKEREENDPVVEGKVMTVEVYPYYVALIKGRVK